MKLWNPSIASLILLSGLAACGGGSEADSAEGFWAGSLASGKTGALVALADGQLWALVTDGFDASTPDVQVVAGRTYVASVSGGSREFSGEGNYLTYDDNSVLRGTGTASGTIGASEALDAQLPDGSHFAGTFRPTFTEAVPLPALAGTYRGRIMEANAAGQAIFPGTLTVGSDGSVRHTSGQCETTGLLEPLSRPLQVVAAQIERTGLCPLGQSRRSGVAVLDTAVDPARIYIMADNADHIGGFYFVGVRCGTGTASCP